MNRVVASRFLALRRSVMRQPQRNGSHGHEIVNPGPPCTFDLMPIPHQSYQQVHGELNAKFNTMLAVGFTSFVLSFAYAVYEDVFSFEAMRAPKFYRERK
ncbi:unnamed protein product [Auanema sp. JU1783]|nr:unnamed protein product [Auanema sp. JU1783]